VRRYQRKWNEAGLIDRAFAFDQAKAAFSYMESRAHFEKVAIKI
jgi:hypothetical protein